MNLQLLKLKTLYYPGSEFDFSTLKYFIKNSNIKRFYYCDYMNYEVTEYTILEKLKNALMPEGYHVSHIAEIRPEYFNQSEWSEFWHIEAIPFGGSIENSYISLFKIKNDVSQWELFYFGTEAIQTYEVLLSNKIKMDVVVTQDHGLGGLWTSFCTNSLLTQVAEKYSKMPKMLFVGDDCDAWNGYVQLSEPFGVFGMHEQNRIIYQKSP